MSTFLTPLRRALLGALFILALGVHSAWGQGASRQDRERAQELADYVASEHAGALPALVDLRRYLPPVGRQTMNDCAAWAFGYAGRTYLEAINQGWQPNSPERVFSPTFIYNQVNHGEDNGSRIDEVLNLLRDKGAATLATAPYLAEDYLTKVPERALDEARVFPIQGYRVLANGAAVRQALADGNIVMCCVRTNPVFSSGRYDIYTQAKHEEGDGLRRPGQPHGFHAMAIVGYDDARQAFLFMNSWGQDWGQRGFVWVGYDALERFNDSEMTELLVDFAVVMIDNQQTVVRQNGEYAPFNQEQIQIKLRKNGVYWNREKQANEFLYSARLAIDSALVPAIKSVTWATSAGGGLSFKLLPQDAGEGFPVLFYASETQVKITAYVEFRDRNERTEYEATLEVDPLAPRDVSLRRIDDVAFTTAGLTQVQWTVIPEMPETDWNDLKSISFSYEYEPGKWYGQIYNHPGGGQPKWQPNAEWTPTHTTPNPWPIKAVFRFADGGSAEFQLEASPFEPRTTFDEPLTLTATWRPEGNDQDRSWWFYEVCLDMPAGMEDEIDGVVYWLHSASWETQVAPELVRQVGRSFYVDSGYTARPFGVDATVFFKRDLARLGTFQMLTATVDLGPEMAYDNELGLGIEYDEEYAGLVDSEPTWEFRLRVDGTGNPYVLGGAVWTIDGEEYEAFSDAPSGVAFEHVVRASAGFDAAVTVRDLDWNETTFTRRIEPHVAPNDAFGVDLVRGTARELAEKTPSRLLAKVNLNGASERVNAVAAIDVLARLPWGAMALTTIPTDGIGAPRQSFDGRVEVSAGEPTWTLVRNFDGSVMALAAMPRAELPEARPPRLQIEATERYLGVRNGVPTWRADFALHGNLEFLAAIQTVTWSAVAIDGTHPVLQIESNPRAGQLTTTEPVALRAEITFAETSALPPTHLESLVTTLSKRHAETLEIGLTSDWKEYVPWNPNTDPLDIEDFGWLPFVTYLHGPEDILQRVRSVQWAFPYVFDDDPVPDVNFDEIEASTQAFSDIGGFPVRSGTSDEGWTSRAHAKARVTLESGVVLNLERPISASDLGVGLTRVRAEVFDHGPAASEELDRERLVSIELGDSDPMRRTQWIDYHFSGPAHPAGAGGLAPPARAFSNPGFRRDFVIAGPVEMNGWVAGYLGEWGSGFLNFNEQENAIDPIALAIPEEQSTRIELLQDPHGMPGVHFVQIQAPTSVIGRLQRVEYELHFEDQMRTLIPFLPIGELSQTAQFGRFDARVLSADLPDKIVARLFEAGASAPLLTLTR